MYSSLQRPPTHHLSTHSGACCDGWRRSTEAPWSLPHLEPATTTLLQNFSWWPPQASPRSGFLSLPPPLEGCMGIQHYQLTWMLCMLMYVSILIMLNSFMCQARCMWTTMIQLVLHFDSRLLCFCTQAFTKHCLFIHSPQGVPAQAAALTVNASTITVDVHLSQTCICFILIPCIANHRR